MKKKSSPPEKPTLRERAEGLVDRKASAALTLGDLQRLVHELEVHQTELELQNEELRATRHALGETVARYTSLYEFAPVSYVALDEEGNIVELNLRATRRLGALTKAKRQLGSFVADDDLPAWRSYLLRVLASDDAGEEGCELTLIGRDGPIEMRFTATRQLHPQGGILVALEDVTERRRAERAVREAATRKDQFLAVLSHELRNPLAPITSGLQVLAISRPDSESALRARATIERQVAHLTRLVDDLLDVTRIGRGKVHLQPVQMDLVDLVRRTIDDHRAAFEHCGIRVETRLGFEPLWLKADATRIAQVLGNLLGNCVKFTPRGGSVLIATERDQANAVLRVLDTGVGISPEDRLHLFEPFVQSPQTLDRSRGGLGLGLAMVKGLVELHDGSVEVVSAGRGRGTEVLVRLPVLERPTSTPPRPGTPLDRSHRILVIEDNVDAANTLMELLQLRGQEARVAYDGMTGLGVAREFEPDIVFCDIGLPGMDGYEIARAFRRDEMLRKVRLVALSGYAQPEDIQRASEAGFDEHLAKPPRWERLEELLAASP